MEAVIQILAMCFVALEFLLGIVNLIRFNADPVPPIGQVF